MKAKKLVAVGMSVLMLGGLFVGCGNSADTSTGANSGKNVKITIFQSKIEANEGYKKLIAAYEKDHPNVEINLEAVTGNDFGASMKAKMQSDPPTIFSVGGFSDMKDYGDVIEDVSDLDIMQHALEGTTDTFTKDGKVYAMGTWNDFLLPSLIINKQGLQTLPLKTYLFFGQFAKRWDLASAGLVMCMAPIIIFYLFSQKYIVKGITEGAIK